MHESAREGASGGNDWIDVGGYSRYSRGRHEANTKTLFFEQTTRSCCTLMYGQNSTTLQETTRLHDSQTTGNIKHNGDTVHALRDSVAGGLAPIQPSSRLPPQRRVVREFWRHPRSTRIDKTRTEMGVNKVNIR